MASRTRSTGTVVNIPTDGTPPENIKWTDPSVNPQKSNAEINALLEETSVGDAPVIGFPADDLVILPGGLVKDGVVIKNVKVKELTGEDEEALARASQSGTTFHFIDRLLRCGVVQIGDEPVSSKDALLKDLLVGDREQLLLGIRKATYGEEIDINKWPCIKCGNVVDLTMELDDIPQTKMENALTDTAFDVQLSKGRTALVRLAKGADQVAMYEKENINRAEMETVLLSRCVVKVTLPNGQEQIIAAFPSLVRGMSIPDRHAILDELRAKQPGPKYDDVKYACDACGEEVNVAVGLGHLFLHFGWV
jgi:hypothetical protein